MKSNFLIFLLVCALGLNAQRQADAILTGNSFFSTPAESPFANSILYFDADSFLTEDFNTPIVISNFYSRASYADRNGNLKFVSNGWRLLNSYGEVLSYKLWSDDVDWPGGSPDTTRVDLMRGPLFLPDPADSNRVYLFYGEYKRNLPIPTLFYANQDIRFCYALLDVPTQSLISKGHIILEDTTASSDMVALRHGNGRDWWIYKSSLKSNQYYRGLLSTSGLSAFELITIPGLVSRDQAFTFTHFTRDGSMMAHFSTYASKYCQRMDVDRCTGELSNPRETDLNPLFRPADVGNFILSPNGSKFYGYRLNYNDSNYLTGCYQYDFESDSLTYLSRYSGGLFTSPNFKSVYFYARVVDSTGLSTRYLNVIEQPDSLGLSCGVNMFKHVLQNSFVMLTAPNFPSFRLGALEGSACDTIGSVTLKPPIELGLELSIFPNPSRDKLHVRHKQNSQATTQLFLLNTLGQVVYTTELKTEYSNLDAVSLGLPPGVYIVQVHTGNNAFSKKWVFAP